MSASTTRSARRRRARCEPAAACVVAAAAPQGLQASLAARAAAIACLFSAIHLLLQPVHTVSAAPRTLQIRGAFDAVAGPSGGKGLADDEELVGRYRCAFGRHCSMQ